MNSAALSLGIVTGSISRKAGGLFTSVRESAQSLAGNGVGVSIYGLEDEFSAEDAQAWAPLIPQHFASRGPAALGLSPALMRTITNAPHDVMHQHGIWQMPSRSVTQWHRRTGKPYMISPRGMLDPWALNNSSWKKRLVGALFEKENLRRASCLHALNASEAQSMRDFGLENPIAIIPNGTHLPDTGQKLPRPDWLPNDGRKTLLFLGRLHQKKGIIELIEAWSLLKKLAPDVQQQWRLAIAGWDDGGHLATILDTISSGDFALDDIVMPGSLHGKEKDAAFIHSDAFILPSYSEGLPIAVLEAWSWQLPVLMTAACNLPEGFEAGAASELSTEPEDMAEILRDDLGADLARMGLAGRKLVEDRFAWPSIAAQHVAVYRWMLDGGTPPDVVRLD